MKVYLVGGGHRWLEVMKLYLAGEHPVKNGNKAVTWKGCNILESYYYAKDNIHFSRLLKTCENFLLDSGAFTFMQGNHKEKINWDKYTEEYAAFINLHGIDQFVEMDIDSIVGLQEVERLRKKLETMTGKMPIPVWHKSRGKDYFLKMCDNYPYVAFGGILTDGISRKDIERVLPWFIHEAHKRGAKIHGLGYTSVTRLSEFHFDSVDSRAWLQGNMSGFLYQFQNGKMKHIQGNGRLKSTDAARHNFNEWVKFSKYAKLYL